MAERWAPRKYQKQATQWLVNRPEAALFLDPGLGKTSVTLSAFQALQRAGVAKRALVVAPLRVCYLVWTHEAGGELGKWENFQGLTVTLLHGAKKGERLQADTDLYVINFEGLPWLCQEGRLTKLVKRGVELLVVDELSKFKHPRTDRFKALKPHLGRFKRRWGLTGSPASNGLLDLFGQVYVLDQGRRLGRYITHFRHQYFVPTGFKGYNWQPQENAEDRIYAQLADLALPMRAVDHLDLPKLVEQDLWVNLPKKAKQTYDRLEQDLIAQLAEGTVTAANAAVASGKCRQVASGGVYLDEEGLPSPERLVKHLHDAKTQAVQELVGELQGFPLLVAYEFHHDLERLRKALGKDAPAIGGRVSMKETTRLVKAWNNGELPVLLAHPAAMGHGLNLQASGHHICWYSLTWDLELYDQLVRRIWRQGQKAKRVTVHRILARDTLDEVVAAALKGKRRTQGALFKALQELRGRRPKKR